MPFTRESKIYDLFHKDKDYKTEATLLRKKYPKAKTVLEVGAGTGLLTKELFKMGFEVTVIEPSFPMLEILWTRLPMKWRQLWCINHTLEKTSLVTFEKNTFDLVVAHYDILNYVKPEDKEFAIFKLEYWGKKLDIEVWPKEDGVRLFTYKSVDGWHRIRLGIRLGNTAHLLFIYFGKGFFAEKHTLYL
jgi:SAM-dependent methyltransferase